MWVPEWFRPYSFDMAQKWDTLDTLPRGIKAWEGVWCDPAVSLNQPEQQCSTSHCVLNEPWRAGGLMAVRVKKAKGWGKKALLCASGWGERPSTTFDFHPRPNTIALALLSFWSSVTKHKINGGMSTETPQKTNMLPFWVHFKVID